MRKYINKKSGIISSLELKDKKVQVFYWTIFSICLILALMCILPVLWIVISSFKDISEFYSVPPTLIPRSFHPEKLIIAWNKMNLGRYTLNTIIITGGKIVFTIMSCGLAGYVMSRLKPKGSSSMMKIILWSMMLPSSVSLISGYMQAVDFPYLHINFTNNYLYFWLGSLGNAYYVLLFKSFFDSISQSIVEAAMIDGCSEFGIFTRIIVPLSKPIITVIAIFTFNSSWSEFLMPYLMLKDESLKTLSQLIFQVKMSGTQVTQDIYLIMLLISMIPPLIVFLCLQKSIMNGVNIGGIKG